MLRSGAGGRSRSASAYRDQLQNRDDDQDDSGGQPNPGAVPEGGELDRLAAAPAKDDERRDAHDPGRRRQAERDETRGERPPVSHEAHQLEEDDRQREQSGLVPDPKAPAPERREPGKKERHEQAGRRDERDELEVSSGGDFRARCLDAGDPKEVSVAALNGVRDEPARHEQENDERADEQQTEDRGADLRLHQ